MPKFPFNTDFDFDFFRRIPISPFLLFSRTKAISLSYSTLLLLQMTSWSSSAHLELLLYCLLWLPKIRPPSVSMLSMGNAVEPPVSLLKDSTNQSERAKRFAETVSYPNREKARTLSASEVCGHWNSLFFNSWTLNRSFVHPSLHSPSCWGLITLLSTFSSSVKQLAATNRNPMCKHYMLMQMPSVSLIKIYVILWLDCVCIVQDQRENIAHFGII